MVQLQRDLPGCLVGAGGKGWGVANLSVGRGCQPVQPWLAFHKSYPLLLQQLGRNLPAFAAMKDDRPALMARPDVPSLVKHLCGVCVWGGYVIRVGGIELPQDTLQVLSSSH